MNPLEKTVVRLAERIIELETIRIRQDAQIETLIRIAARMIAKDSGQTPEHTENLIRLDCSEEHQAALERIEDTDPRLAAVLDKRVAVNFR